jgi:hypothetical protein
LKKLKQNAFGAAANTILFFVVSIPMSDKRQSRKEGFADYKKTNKNAITNKKVMLL